MNDKFFILLLSLNKKNEVYFYLSAKSRDNFPSVVTLAGDISQKLFALLDWNYVQDIKAVMVV